MEQRACDSAGRAGERGQDQGPLPERRSEGHGAEERGGATQARADLYLIEMRFVDHHIGRAHRVVVRPPDAGVAQAANTG